MAQIDSERIRTAEEETTFIDPTLAGLIKQIDSRTSAANCYPTITRTGGFISQVDYYAEAARTTLVASIAVTRTAGSDGVAYITGLIATFYNADASVDSTVTTTIARDADDNITSCDNVFATGESAC